MCAKRLAEELNEGFIEDYSTPSKKPRQGNLRAMSKDDLCKMVAKAWANVSEEVIKKSFLVTNFLYLQFVKI